MGLFHTIKNTLSRKLKPRHLLDILKRHFQGNAPHTSSVVEKIPTDSNKSSDKEGVGSRDERKSSDIEQVLVSSKKPFPVAAAIKEQYPKLEFTIRPPTKQERKKGITQNFLEIVDSRKVVNPSDEKGISGFVNDGQLFPRTLYRGEGRAVILQDTENYENSDHLPRKGTRPKGAPRKLVFKVCDLSALEAGIGSREITSPDPEQGSSTPASVESSAPYQNLTFIIKGNKLKIKDGRGKKIQSSEGGILSFLNEYPGLYMGDYAILSSPKFPHSNKGYVYEAVCTIKDENRLKEVIGPFTTGTSGRLEAKLAPKKVREPRKQRAESEREENPEQLFDERGNGNHLHGAAFKILDIDALWEAVSPEGVKVVSIEGKVIPPEERYRREQGKIAHALLQVSHNKLGFHVVQQGNGTWNATAFVPKEYKVYTNGLSRYLQLHGVIEEYSFKTAEGIKELRLGYSFKLININKDALLEVAEGKKRDKGKEKIVEGEESGRLLGTPAEKWEIERKYRHRNNISPKKPLSSEEKAECFSSKFKSHTSYRESVDVLGGAIQVTLKA